MWCRRYTHFIGIWRKVRAGWNSFSTCQRTDLQALVRQRSIKPHIGTTARTHTHFAIIPPLWIDRSIIFHSTPSSNRKKKLWWRQMRGWMWCFRHQWEMYIEIFTFVTLLKRALIFQIWRPGQTLRKSGKAWSVYGQKRIWSAAVQISRSSLQSRARWVLRHPLCLPFYLLSKWVLPRTEEKECVSMSPAQKQV